MSSNLISIAANGVSAAEAGLNITAQNIDNAGTTGYVRRSVQQIELTAPSVSDAPNVVSVSGVMVTGVTRNTQNYLSNQVNVSAANAARANGLVTNLTNVESAVENSSVYASIGTFTASLQTLASNPTSTSQRQTVLADAQNMAQSFNLASTTLASAQQTMQSDATNSVSQINQLATNLAQVNQQISANANPATTGATLLDQRDALLSQLSSLTDATTTYNTNGTATLTLGGTTGQTLVSGGTANTLSMTTATNGTISFSLAGGTITPGGGAIAADQQGLASAATSATSLDTVANSIVSVVNTAQSSGTDLTGATGSAIFSGSGAAGISVSMTSASGIATAKAGAAANSTDISNLTAMQTALTTANPAGQTNTLIFNLSSSVQNATTAQTALTAIAAQAKTTADTNSGVDLNTEAANLLQYQQAFQASSKVIQTAETIFTQLLSIN